MLNKNQFELIISILNEAYQISDLKTFLIRSIELFDIGMKPVSIAVYISADDEEKLELVSERGSRFDDQIRCFNNFSIMARRAIKKKNLVYLPSSGKNVANELSNMALLLPLVGSGKNFGLMAMIFPIGDYQKHKADSNFFNISSRLIGYIAYEKKKQGGYNRSEEVNHNDMYSDKMTSLGILSSSLAHELNNIFANIQGYTDLISMCITDSDNSRKALRVINDQTERAAKLIESLNIFIKGQNARLSYYSINEIIHEVIDIHKTAFNNHNINLNINLAEVPRILCEKNQIKEALLNIIHNSLYFLEFNTSRLLSITTEFIDGKVILSIKDNSVNTTSPQLEQVLYPFIKKSVESLEQQENESDKKDLELAIAYGIIQGHGGHLEIETIKDTGRTIKCIFTRTELGGERKITASKKDIQYTNEIKILIVDDEDPIREFLLRAFDNMGYQVIAASDGKEAVEICTFEDIDIVFLDYLMPGLKGDRVFESIKRVNPHSDIVFITGVDEIPDINKLYNEGLAYVLKKPFRMDKISKLTKDLLSKRSNSEGI